MKKRVKLLLALLVACVTGAFAQFDADKTYVISNRNDANVFMQDNGTGVVAVGAFNGNSYWKFEATANADCYYVKNAVTGRYMQSTAGNEVEVATGNTPVEIHILLCTEEGDGMYGFASTDQGTHNFTAGTIGANWKANGTVQGYAAVKGTNHRSFWKVVEYGGLLTSTGKPFYAGDAFLYNVETGYWLMNNNRQTVDWNSHAELDPIGFDFGLLPKNSNNGFQINPKMGANHSLNASNLYMDTGDGVTTWTFESKIVPGVENAYTIKSGDVVLGANNDKFLQKTTNNSTWQVVTKEERLAITQAQFATASGSNPVDLSWLIPGGQFNVADERAMSLNGTSEISAGAAFVAGQTQGNGVRETWNNTAGFDINYTLTGLPAGVYRFIVSGYYRDGAVESIGEKHANGTEVLRAKIYANTKEGTMMSICGPERTSAGQGCNQKTGNYYVPNNIGDAAIATREGLYVNNPIKVIITEGEPLTIGVRKDGGSEWDWTMLDYWKLQYFGPDNLDQYLALLQASIDAATAFDKTTTTDVIAGELQQAINDATAKLSSDDSDEVEAATSALDAALNKAKNLNVTILRQTIALAKADGADTSAAEDFVENGTSASEMGNILTALRIARRVANAEKDNNTYDGNEPAAGDFYLLNVGQKRFFCGGDDWGAHAALGFPGIVITLEENGSSFRINTHLQNGTDGNNKKEYLNFGGYCDTWNADETSWNFVPQGGGKYVIARSNNDAALLGYSNNTYNRLDTDKSGADNPDNQWILVTKAQRDALYEAAAQVTDQPVNAVDVSYLIKSPNFSQREDVSAWTLSNTAIWGRGANHPDFAIEAYNQTSASVEQTVTGLKPGTYRLKVQAFYRDGNFNKQAEILDGGGEARQLATLYAGTKSALIQNVSGGADKAPGMGRSSSVGYMPDGIDDACLFFQSGLYWAQLDKIVVTSSNPSITFGARKTEKINDGDWFVLDNFRLEYLGAYVDLSEVKDALSAKITEATTAMTIPVTFLSNAISNAETAMGELQDADVIANANIALTNALNKYITAKNDLITLQQTVEKAKAEGLDEDAALATAQSVADADQLASVIDQQLYNVRADRKINALRVADVYTGAAPAEGKVYLYNIGTGMFLGMGSDWNTHAAVDQVGIEITLEADGDNFKLITAHGSFNGGEHGPYTDTGDNTPYTFVAVEGKANVYNIKQGDLLMGWNPNAATDGKKYWNSISNVAGASATDANFQWKVITADERETLEAAASDVNAVDVSYKISNPSLVRKPGYDMWQKTAGARVNTTDDNNGDRAADYGYEFFDTNDFSFTQTVTGLKPGNYRVSVQGFYRDGNGAYQAGVVNNSGELLQKAYLVGGDAQAFLPNIASEMDVVPGLTDIQTTDLGNMPNWPNSAIEYFQHGAYWTTVDAKVGANGELTIGVKKDEKANDGDWVVLDNFRLAYLGAPYGINTMSIMGDFTGGWDFADNQHMTQDANDPYIWTLTVDNFKPTEAKSYIYKATANERWDVYEYPQGQNNNQDWYFGSNEYPINHYYTLVFTMNTATHTLNLNVTMKTNVVTISETETFVPEDNPGATIVLNRRFNTNAEAWNTFVVPFNISNSELKRAFGKNVAVAGYSEDSDDPENVTVHFDTMDEPAVTANVPVLLKTDTTATEFIFEADVVAGDPVKTGKNFDLVGSYASLLTIAKGDYFLNDHTLYKSAGTTTLMGTRAYLKAKTAEAARIANIVFDEEEGVVTGITEIATEKASERIYNLSGQKVNAMQRKGLYIKDGKKVMK